MGLVATFDPTFHMFWPRVDVVHPNRLRMSTIWDGCLKCYVPASPFLVLLIIFGVIIIISALVYVAVCIYKKKAQDIG